MSVFHPTHLQPIRGLTAGVALGLLSIGMLLNACGASNSNISDNQKVTSDNEVRMFLVGPNSLFGFAADGTTVFESDYDGTDNFDPDDAVASPNGLNVIACGTERHRSNTQYEHYVVYFDLNGKIKFKHPMTPGLSRCRIATNDAGTVVAVATNWSTSEIVALDSEGELLWRREYLNSSPQTGQVVTMLDVVEGPSNGFYTASTNYDQEDFERRITRLDPDGVELGHMAVDVDPTDLSYFESSDRLMINGIIPGETLDYAYIGQRITDGDLTEFLQSNAVTRFFDSNLVSTESAAIMSTNSIVVAAHYATELGFGTVVRTTDDLETAFTLDSNAIVSPLVADHLGEALWMLSSDAPHLESGSHSHLVRIEVSKDVRFDVVQSNLPSGFLVSQ